jgi:hypothetical protein
MRRGSTHRQESRVDKSLLPLLAIVALRCSVSPTGACDRAAGAVCGRDVDRTGRLQEARTQRLLGGPVGLRYRNRRRSSPATRERRQREQQHRGTVPWFGGRERTQALFRVTVCLVMTSASTGMRRPRL